MQAASQELKKIEVCRGIAINLAIPRVHRHAVVENCLFIRKRATLCCHPYKRRCQMRYRVLIAVVGSLVTLATVAKAQQVGALLTGYEESPSVSTTATGAFSATIAEDGDVIQYTETFSGLQAPITQSHIHIAQAGVNGSVVIFLCQTAANPDPTGLAPHCPQEGAVSGTITAANVIAGATASQQLQAGDLAAVVTAIRAGMAYANVHTTLSPGGEIRGQIRVIAK